MKQRNNNTINRVAGSRPNVARAVMHDTPDIATQLLYPEDANALHFLQQDIKTFIDAYKEEFEQGFEKLGNMIIAKLKTLIKEITYDHTNYIELPEYIENNINRLTDMEKTIKTSKKVDENFNKHLETIKKRVKVAKSKKDALQKLRNQRGLDIDRLTIVADTVAQNKNMRQEFNTFDTKTYPQGLLAGRAILESRFGNYAIDLNANNLAEAEDMMAFKNNTRSFIRQSDTLKNSNGAPLNCALVFSFIHYPKGHEKMPEGHVGWVLQVTKDTTNPDLDQQVVLNYHSGLNMTNGKFEGANTKAKENNRKESNHNVSFTDPEKTEKTNAQTMFDEISRVIGSTFIDKQVRSLITKDGQLRLSVAEAFKNAVTKGNMVLLKKDVEEAVETALQEHTNLKNDTIKRTMQKASEVALRYKASSLRGRIASFVGSTPGKIILTTLGIALIGGAIALAFPAVAAAAIGAVFVGAAKLTGLALAGVASGIGAAVGLVTSTTGALFGKAINWFKSRSKQVDAPENALATPEGQPALQVSGSNRTIVVALNNKISPEQEQSELSESDSDTLSTTQEEDLRRENSPRSSTPPNERSVTGYETVTTQPGKQNKFETSEQDKTDTNREKDTKARDNTVTDDGIKPN